MRARLRNCCFFIPLRVACLISALILIFFELIAVPQRNPGDPESLKGILVAAYKLLNMVHSIGCLMLFVAYFVRFAALVRVFLITDALHIIVTPIFLFLELFFWGSDLVDVGIAFAGIFLSLYFWLVAHAFYHQCKDDRFTERGSLPAEPEIRSGSTFA